MSDHEPMDPTRIDTPVVGEPPIPTDPPYGEPPTDGGDRGDRNMRVAIGVLIGLIVLVGAILLFTTSDDDSDVDTATSTTESTTTTADDTTTSESTTTTEATTTSTSTTSTTATPPTTCSGTEGPPDNAAPVAQRFINAWQVGDRPCAEAIGAASAVNTLFGIEPGPATPSFSGCTEVDDGDPHIQCAFTYEGGATILKMNFGAIDGWRVFEVLFAAD